MLGTRNPNHVVNKPAIVEKIKEELAATIEVAEQVIEPVVEAVVEKESKVFDNIEVKPDKQSREKVLFAKTKKEQEELIFNYTGKKSKFLLERDRVHKILELEGY